ncbi:MAG: hypothetical protein ACKV2O_17240 [Acidimicrobiales bacterium]
MASYQVILTDRSVQEISEAHAFQQEGPMTTFFRNDEDRHVVDSWSTRVFSVRTAEVLMIRRVGDRDGSANCEHVGSDHVASHLGSVGVQTEATLVGVGVGVGVGGSGGAGRACARRPLAS